MKSDLSMFADDPFGYRDDLRDALSDPELSEPAPAGDRAAYRVARALGRCRLFGVAPGDDLDGVLPAPLAAAAAAELTRLLTTWADEARRLGERWDAAIDPSEADNLCAGLLGARMSAWAVGVALEEAYLDCAEEDPARAALAAAIDGMQDALDRFDEGLEGHTDVLATVAGTKLLEGWRTQLAPAFREDLPWWLDGRLEEAAQACDAGAARTLPGPALWATVRRQAARFLNGVPVLPPVGGGVLAAADTPGTAVAAPGQTLCWLSPDGAWRAELQLPEKFTPEEEGPFRPVNFTRRVDDRPAVELAGQLVRLGGAEDKLDDKGQVWLRLADLREAGGLRLRLGSPPEEWRCAPQGD
jgi:hypothetical protein